MTLIPHFWNVFQLINFKISKQLWTYYIIHENKLWIYYHIYNYMLKTWQIKYP